MWIKAKRDLKLIRSICNAAAISRLRTSSVGCKTLQEYSVILTSQWREPIAKSAPQIFLFNSPFPLSCEHEGKWGIKKPNHLP